MASSSDYGTAHRFRFICKGAVLQTVKIQPIANSIIFYSIMFLTATKIILFYENVELLYKENAKSMLFL